MITIYCDKCKEEVEVKRDCICPKCKTDWSKQVKEEVDVDEVFFGIKDSDADETVQYILSWGNYFKFIYGIIGIIAIIAGIVVMFEDILVGLGILVCGIACFGYGLFVQHANKWKAYMLHYTVHGKK